MVDDVLILAGGVGTRLWPASLKGKPKQFLDPGTGESLIVSTLKRAQALSAAGRIVIVTHRHHVAPLYEACRGLDEELKEKIVVLPEPAGKNTAPAIAFGMHFLTAGQAGAASQRRRTVLVLAADHLIEPVSAFKKAVERADTVARDGFIVTFGVNPTHAETGYGYIEAGEPRGNGFMVKSFREKPDRQTAEMYVKSGHFYWNSGMFVLPADTFAAELTRYAPRISRAFALDGQETGVSQIEKVQMQSDRGVETAETDAELAERYASLPSISIDYALMEHSGHVAGVEADFSWTDLGSWDEIAALHTSAPAAAGENLPSGAALEIESERNFVRSELPVVLCAVSDLVVVQENGKLLVCRRNQTQLVKQAVERLQESGREELL